MTKIKLAVGSALGCDVTAPICFGPARRNGAVTPNMALQRTCRNVTPLAFASVAPSRQAAELGC